MDLSPGETVHNPSYDELRNLFERGNVYNQEEPTGEWVETYKPIERLNYLYDSRKLESVDLEKPVWSVNNDIYDAFFRYSVDEFETGEIRFRLVF